MAPIERPTASDASPSQSSSELLNDHWNNIGDDLTVDHSNSITVQSSWQEEAHWMSFRHAVQKFAMLKTRSAPIQEEDEDGESEENNDSNNIQRVSSPSSSLSETSALASDLAETRMRLALAQAERDELEFVLLQHKQQH
ncbi:hypothetical protein MHU86_2161 [Fragilaria crotonensis]|nr:hypothetical protein MHU86_2161 [Fragilaria crotonensis]